MLVSDARMEHYKGILQVTCIKHITTQVWGKIRIDEYLEGRGVYQLALTPSIQL